jgi:hypothetical protein
MRPFIFFHRTFFTGVFLFLLMVPESSLLAGEPFLPPHTDVPAQNNPVSDTTTGHYKVYFSLGVLPGSMEVIQTTPISLGMSHGYYNKGVFTGIGMAVENFQPAFFPVFADVRFYLGGKQCRPYVRGILGKNFVFGQPPYSGEDMKTKGKIVTGIGGGISYPAGTHTSLFFYLGYRYMKYTTTHNLQNPVKEDYTFNRLEFRLGISF